MIEGFKDEYRWLSNFVPAEVYLDGRKYRTVEHAYVAAKTLNPVTRFEIQAMPKAYQAKAFGKTIQLRPDWDEVKLSVMENLVRQKFRIPEYEEKLLATGDCLIVEWNNWHDTFWGKCHCEEHNGAGENNLGKLIMQVRDELAQPLLTFE